MNPSEYSIFTLIRHGFLMLLWGRKIYNKETYRHLFIFRDNYKLAGQAFLAVLLYTLGMAAFLYFSYGEYLNARHIVFFIVALSLIFYLVGLYSLFPLKSDVTPLYYLLQKSFLRKEDSSFVSENYNFYGLMVLLRRLDKHDPKSYPEEYDLIRKLNRIEDDFAKETQRRNAQYGDEVGDELNPHQSGVRRYKNQDYIDPYQVEKTQDKTDSHNSDTTQEESHSEQASLKSEQSSSAKGDSKHDDTK